jgi:hypothetical protein
VVPTCDSGKDAFRTPESTASREGRPNRISAGHSCGPISVKRIALCTLLLVHPRLSIGAEPVHAKPGQWETRVTSTITRLDNPTPEEQGARELGYTPEQRKGFEHFLKTLLEHTEETSTVLSCVSQTGGVQELDFGAHETNSDDHGLYQSQRDYRVQRHRVNAQFVSDENIRIHLTGPMKATYIDEARTDARIADLKVTTVGTSRWISPRCYTAR